MPRNNEEIWFPAGCRVRGNGPGESINLNKKEPPFPAAFES
ncbi:MAG: hypothetical protein OJF48_003767 [Afipia sp.]|jgi:hypothetical protein|nr:MAG: hypothetical protein OJF48_003767 [Afipia sp.]